MILEAKLGDDPLGVFWDSSKIKSCSNRIIFITKTSFKEDELMHNVKPGTLAHSRKMFNSDRNHSVDLNCKSIDWFLCI